MNNRYLAYPTKDMFTYPINGYMMGTSLKLLRASDLLNEWVMVRPSTIARACQCMPPRPNHTRIIDIRIVHSII